MTGKDIFAKIVPGNVIFIEQSDITTKASMKVINNTLHNVSNNINIDANIRSPIFWRMDLNELIR